jgi:methylglutaconyl-CoA hydratase
VVLNLDRPATKNALGSNLMNQFRSCLTELQFDPTARVVLVASQVPGAFCSGADLKERVAMTPAQVASFVHGLRAAFTQLQNLPQPTIAAIDGAAFGGGLEMALACDMRTAGKDAKLGLTETGKTSAHPMISTTLFLWFLT